MATALENQAVGAYTAALAAAKAGKLGTVPPAVGTFATTAITGVPLSNQPATLSALGAVTDVTSPGGIATAASMAPVEAMHATILNFVIGQYPVPDDFLSTTMAASPTLLTV